MITNGNFTAQLLAHSRQPCGLEALSFETTYERFIHSELLTHRAFARNASSSRAIPYRSKKPGGFDMRSWIYANPALPLHMGTDKPGMQAGDLCDDPAGAQAAILEMLDQMFAASDVLVSKFKLHKEIVNRYTEPWGWIKVVITTGRAGFMNFLKLRMSPKAHPNIQRLAVNMARLYRASEPVDLREGDWHLPYIPVDQWLTIHQDLTYVGEQPKSKLLIWSGARCTWVSYNNPDKNATINDATIRHDTGVNLKHMTPMEHQLRARGDKAARGCVPGYDQYRKLIPGESCDDFDYESLLDNEYAERDYVIG